MRVRLTDGKSLFTFYICKIEDAKEWQAVATSSKPVSKAVDIIKARLGAGVFAGLFPAPGICVEGIPS